MVAWRYVMAGARAAANAADYGAAGTMSCTACAAATIDKAKTVTFDGPGSHVHL